MEIGTMMLLITRGSINDRPWSWPQSWPQICLGTTKSPAADHADQGCSSGRIAGCEQQETLHREQNENHLLIVETAVLRHLTRQCS